jgi:uncharacterized protein with HEPN domain
MQFMYDQKLVSEILTQVRTAIQTIIQRFEPIKSAQDFVKTPEGKEKLDAICMQLIAIGESIKNIDKITGSSLLSQYPEINWKGVKGIRDVISHQYFDIDAEEIFGVCSENIIPLSVTVQKMIDELEK